MKMYEVTREMLSVNENKALKTQDMNSLTKIYNNIKNTVYMESV